MGVFKVEGGYRWGKSGKIYNTKLEAQTKGKALADSKKKKEKK